MFVTGFRLYSMPLDISIEGKRKGLLGTFSTLDIHSLLHFLIILGNVKNLLQYTVRGYKVNHLAINSTTAVAAEARVHSFSFLRVSAHIMLN